MGKAEKKIFKAIERIIDTLRIDYERLENTKRDLEDLKVDRRNLPIDKIIGINRNIMFHEGIIKGKLLSVEELSEDIKMNSEIKDMLWGYSNLPFVTDFIRDLDRG